MKKNYKTLAPAIALLALTGVGAAAETIDVNVIVGPNEPTYKGWIAAKEYIEAETGGSVELRVFHSGQLGAQQTRIVDVQHGQYDAAEIPPANMASLYPPVGVLSAPYIFRDAEHMGRVFESGIGKELVSEFEAASGIKVLDVWYYGTRHLTTNKLGTTPEELSDVNMRIFDAPIAYEFANALGTVATPISFNELYLALKTGTVEAQENPIPTIHAQKFYEVQDYLVLTGHVVDALLPVINLDSWNALSESEQAIFLEGVRLGGDVADGIVIAKEQSLISELESYGMKVVEVDTSPFVARARAAYANRDEWGETLITQITSVD